MDGILLVMLFVATPGLLKSINCFYVGRALGRGGNRHRPAKGVGEDGGISGGGTKSGGRVRVNAFTVRVDEYKEELRQVRCWRHLTVVVDTLVEGSLRRTRRYRS